MSRIPVDSLLIGAHTSIAGGAHHALLEGASIGATTIQIFTANQKQWQGKAISEEEVQRFQKTKDETGIQVVMSHAGYLLNLGSPNEEVRTKSKTAFLEEIERCQQLELSFLNLHPGAALKEDRQLCLERICENIKAAASIWDTPLVLLLETMAGQGSVIGSCFEELAYLIDRLKNDLPIGICMDTCHMFVAGYDIRTFEGWEKTLAEFDRIIGLHYLYAFHVNDSMYPLGSKKDRHASLGEGEVGMHAFEFIMRHPQLREIPKYLETPNPEIWDKEIWKLREFARNPPLYHAHEN